MKFLLPLFCLMFVFIGLDLNGQCWEWQNPLPHGNTYNDIFFVDDIHGWRVGENGMIEVTTNGANTWDFQESGTNWELESVFFIDDQKGWACGWRGTLITTDNGGNTWYSQGNLSSFSQFFSVFFVDSDKGWLVNASGDILSTDDGGDNWYIQNDEDFSWLEGIYFIDAQKGWTVGWDGTILTTNNGGDNWSLQNNPATSRLFDLHFIDNQIGWVVGRDGVLLKTNDGGNNWVLQSIAATGDLRSVYFIDSERGWIVGSSGEIYTTNDGGNLWTIQNSGSSNYLYDVFIHENLKGIAVGEYGSILITNDGGNTWEQESSGIVAFLSSVYFLNSQQGWAVGELPNTSGILTTNDGGNNWTIQTSPTSPPLESVYFTNSQNGWSVGGQGTILFTNNGGNNWDIYESGTTSWLYDVFFIDEQKGWIVGSSGLILSTNNGGIDWTSQVSNTNKNLESVFFINEQKGWISGDSTILMTNNGGMTWNPQDDNDPLFIFDIFFIDEQEGWAVGSEISHTTDGGNTWIEQNTSSLDPLYYGVFFVDSQNGWIIGRGTILNTDNGGATWTYQESDNDNYLLGINFTDNQNGWIVGEGGTILKYSSDIPSCATELLYPQNNANDIPLQSQITWAEANGCPDGYYLSLGTESGNSDLLAETDVGNTTTYMPSEAFPPSSTIYVNIRPYNSTGIAENCAEFSFETRDLTCRERDSLVLLTLYEVTNGNGWEDNTNWLSDQPLGEWYGVTTNEDGCVTELSLFSNDLSGEIPDLNLPNLELFSCAFNSLSGTIPNFSNLPSLEILHCLNNNLNGTIPDFSNLPNLRELICESNSLSGEIPNFTNISNLETLVCGNNNLSGGIPNFTNLPNLKEFYCESSDLEGTIPNFNNLPNLEVFWASDNELSETIPSELGNLSNLRFLNLSNNQLSGNIPLEIGNLSNLTKLYLQDNQLEGCFPNNIITHCGLNFSTLEFNNGYNLTNNPQLSWQGDFQRFCNGEEQIGAPCDDGNSDTENDIITTDCECLGTSITQSCRYQDSLELVVFYHATNGDNWTYTATTYVSEIGVTPIPNAGQIWSFSQPIDTWHGVAVNEEECVILLALPNNGLSGGLPDLNLPNLEELNCTFNDLNGSIPNFTSLSNLQRLILIANNLNGGLPNLNLPNLEAIYLTGNNLSGEIPNFSNLSNLKEIDFFGNDLTGTIPDFTNLANLETFYCAFNNLNGEIPNFSNLSNLRDLVINNNELNGSIPNFVNLPNLEKFFCASNSLDEEIPNLANNCPLLQDFRFDNNQFTFEDILTYFNQNQTLIEANATASYHQFLYSPQDSITTNLDLSSNVNSTLNIHIPIDEEISSNVYTWYKDGEFYTEIEGSGDLTFESIQLDDAGTYWVHITNPNVPDLVLEGYTVHIMVDCPTINIVLEETICADETYTVGDETFSESGDYNIVLQNNAGCDSLVALHLEIGEMPIFEQMETICMGASLVVGDSVYTQTGNYENILITANGCDSIIQTNLTVEDLQLNLDDDQSICAGESVPVDATVNNCLNCTYTWSDNNNINTPVRNLSPTSSTNYSVTVTSDAGCAVESSIFITVNNQVEISLEESICQGENITIDNQTFDITGNYEIPLTNSNGCDSTIFLQLEVQEMNVITQNPTICIGETFTIGNSTYTEAGFYEDTLRTSIGCDSLIFQTQLGIQNLQTTLGNDQTICTNTPISLDAIVNDCPDCNYIWNDNNNTNSAILNISPATSNTYIVTITSDIGCTIQDTIHIAVNNEIEVNLTETICQGKSIIIDNQTFSTTGNYQVNLISQTGCDSTIFLDLTVLPVIPTNVNTEICTGESITIANEAFTETGNYIIEFQTPAGCDTIVELDLLVKDKIETNLVEDFCEGGSIVIGTDTLKATGNYDIPLISEAGCDSLVHLELTVHQNIEIEHFDKICDNKPYPFGNQTLTKPGDYQELFTSIHGCDSLVFLTLEAAEATLYQIEATICDQDTYWFSNQQLSEEGFYPDTISCDSIVELYLQILDIAAPYARDDDYLFLLQDDKIKLDILENDSLPNENVQLEVLDVPDESNVKILNDRRLEFEGEAGEKEELFFEYIVCIAACPQSCDTATVRIRFERDCLRDAEQNIPNAFSPISEQGIYNTSSKVNNFFDPFQEYDDLDCDVVETDATLLIVNRWGEVIYKADPYQPWDGKNGQKEMPQGTYYYVFSLGESKNYRIRRSITLLRED